MRAGAEHEALTELADRLCAELGHPIEGELPESAQSDEVRAKLFGDLLTPEQERLVTAVRRSLAWIAAALEADHPKVVSETAYRALLDGAELVTRSELAQGNSVTALVPSFVFLIALPMITNDEALELSRRASALLEQTID